jgi:hypothetical protein
MLFYIGTYSHKEIAAFLGIPISKFRSFEVRSKDLPAQQVMSVNRETFISDLQAHLDGSIKTLMIYAQVSGAQISGLPLAIYRGAVREERHAQVEICLPVTGQLRPTITDNEHAVDGDVQETYHNFNTSIFSPSASMDDPCVEIAWPYR